MTLTRVIACSLKIGKTLPFLQLKPKLATIFFSEMLLFWHTFNLISFCLLYTSPSPRDRQKKIKGDHTWSTLKLVHFCSNLSDKA